ncbi:MAG: hypothetical protein ACYCS2_04930, partial [Acidimicrobiales bacterium]
NAIFVALILLVLVVPQLTGGFSPLYTGLVAIFNILWSHVVGGISPAIYFPNIVYALSPGGSGLASALGTPCRFT